MIELLGNFSREFSLSTKTAKKYFRKSGKLRNIGGFHYWPLRNVLMEKYRIIEEEALALESFLLPMLVYEPELRASAQDCLRHPWLKMTSNYEYRMSREEFDKILETQSERMTKIQDQSNQRNTSGTPEKLRIPEMLDADIEDNLSASEEEVVSAETSEYGFDENISYHDAMNKIRTELFDKKDK
jgi:serine/threonine protein kinase